MCTKIPYENATHNMKTYVVIKVMANTTAIRSITTDDMLALTSSQDDPNQASKQSRPKKETDIIMTNLAHGGAIPHTMGAHHRSQGIR